MLPFAFWKSSAAVFNPATLALSGWWRASYTGAPWAARASAGTSLANGDLETNGNDPATGAATNGLTPPDFDGVNDNLRNLADITNFVTTGAGTVIALFNADSAIPPTGTIYDDAALLVDGNADFALTFTTSGVTGVVYSGGYVSKSVACSPASGYHLVMMRYDSTNLGMTLDSAAETTVACGALTNLAGFINTGMGYLGGRYLDGRILELMTASTKLTTTDYADIKSYVNSRYALAL